MAHNIPTRDTSLLFGIIFTLAGSLIAFFVLIKPLVLIERSRDWVETPAHITSLELHKTKGKSGYNYTLEIFYQYEFDGNTHTSKRAGTMLGAEDVANYNRLKPAFDAKRPVTCLVNPRNPREAVIDRSIDFENPPFLLLNAFAILFPLFGLFMLLTGLSMRPAPGPGARQIPLRGAPLYVTLVPTCVAVAYVVFIFYCIRHYTPWPWYFWLMLLPAAITTLLCAYRILYKLAFHGSRLDLARVVPLGETLSASLHVPGKIEPQIPVKLVCLRTATTTEKHGNKTSTTTHTAPSWQVGTLATPYFDGRNTTLSFRVETPADQPATSVPPLPNPSFAWQIQAKIKHFGIVHTLAFDLPLCNAQLYD